MNEGGLVFSENGLLPRVDDEQFEWSRPDFSSASPLDDVAGWVVDIGVQMQFVWPAAWNGELVAPPMQHLLDQLVRERTAGARPEVDAEQSLHPHPMTIAEVWELPECDFCAVEGRERAARYDAPRAEPADGAWANMCEDHYRSHGSGLLGAGEGQYLVLTAEVPAELWEALEVAVAYWANWEPPQRG